MSEDSEQPGPEPAAGAEQPSVGSTPGSAPPFGAPQSLPTPDDAASAPAGEPVPLEELEIDHPSGHRHRPLRLPGPADRTGGVGGADPSEQVHQHREG